MDDGIYSDPFKDLNKSYKDGIERMNANYNSLPRPYPTGAVSQPHGHMHKDNECRHSNIIYYNPVSQNLQQSLPQRQQTIADTLLKLLIGLVVVAYLFQLFVLPWIYSNTSLAILLVIIFVVMVYLAGYTVKKVAGAMGNGIIRLIREIKR